MIYPLGVDILHLLQESFALLPPSARWNATYTTFYTKLPPGVECRLRCAIDGTAEAEQLRKRYELNVLDLCRPLGQAPANKWTEAGRAGTQPKFDRQYAESVSASEPQPDSNADDDSCYEVDLADLATPLPPPLPGARIAHINLETKYSVSRRRAFTERRQAWLLTLAVILALSTFLGLAATAIPLVRSKIVAAWTIAAARIGNAPSDISTPASKAEGAKQLTKPESGDGSRPAQPPRTPQQLEQGGNATAQGASPATPDGIAPNSPGSADSSEHPRLGGDSNESPPPQQSTGAVGESLAGEKVQSDAVSTSPPETRPVKAPEEHRPKLITRFRPLKPDGSLGGIQNVTLTFNEPIQPATMTWSVFYPPSSSKSTIEIDHVDSQVVLVSKQRGNDTRIAKVSASRDGAVFVFMPKVFIQRNELSDPEWVRQFRSSLIEFRAASAERELRYLVSFHRPQKFDPITIPTSKEDASPNYSKKHYTLLWCIGFAQPQLRIYINSKLKHRSVPLSPDAASPSVVDLRPISRCLTLRLSASLSTDDDPGKRESLDLELVPVGPQGDLTFQELKAWYKGVSSFFRSATKGIKEGRKSISAADDYIRSSLNNKNVKKKAELEALRAKLEQLKLDYERVPTDLDADELFRELEQLRIDYQLVYAVHTSSNAPVSSAEKLVLYGSTRDIDQRIVEVDQ